MSKQKYFKVLGRRGRWIFLLALLHGDPLRQALAAGESSAIPSPLPAVSSASAPTPAAGAGPRFVSRHAEAAFYGFGFLGLLLFGVGAGAGGILRRERYHSTYRSFPYGSYFDQRRAGGPRRLYGASSGAGLRESLARDSAT